MANRYIPPSPTENDDQGLPYVGGKLYFYVTGTSTPAATYSNNLLTIPNANPVELDERGAPETEIFLDPAITYKVKLEDANGAEIWTRDPVVDPAANVTAAVRVVSGDPNGQISGNAGTLGGAGASMAFDIANQLLYVATVTGNALTTVWTQVGAVLGGAVRMTGVLSPATIAANQNDYSPTNLAAASVLRLTSSQAVRITGIAGGVAGRLLEVVNTGAFLIVLPNEDAGSTAANRILSHGPILLPPQRAVLLQYDAVSQRWRPMSAINSDTIVPPQGRLTLTTLTPVQVADVTAGTSVYYTPFVGRYLPINYGDGWVMMPFAELTLALSSNAGHTNYHQSGKNFDVFAFDDGGTIRIGTGPAWSSDTARGTGAGTTEISRDANSALWVNTVAIALRYGSASGDITSSDVAAGRATYLGSFRTIANGQTCWIAAPAAASGGGNARLYVWNAYQQIDVSAYSLEADNTWTYASATLRAANGSNSNRISILRGLNEGLVVANVTGQGRTGSASERQISIGLDSTSATATGCLVSPSQGMNVDIYTNQQALLRTMATGLGHHFFQWLEAAGGGTSTTFYGDNSQPSVQQNGISLQTRM